MNITNIAGFTVVSLQRDSLLVDKNPYLLEHKSYFERIAKARARLYLDYQAEHSKLLRTQKGLCPICDSIIMEDQRVEVDHIVPISKGGDDTLKNKRIVH